MSVRPPAPGRYQPYPRYPQPAPAHPFGRPYAPVPPRPRPAGDPGLITAVVGLVLFFVVTLPIFVIGTVMELNPVITLSSTTSTLFLSVRAFCISKRYGHTNVIAVITMTLCMLLLLSGLASAVIRLLLIL
ncbi:Uncharacterised protein (plasmid) [Tsukamurella tyrosinosolvens]|uniref:Uncharacterized protein n=1 Tax=Tsukamurella tyrosinosolvens TaxID=57704 RepID=A0A1H4MXB7_TSUTY|nr:hypothetical protein [Tsukamurella tyrosinosolvens]SEB87288.1 hypothetical protein SAMN04489793_0987 [Tsukamurella tyrosinosolvens]VEI00575.1 Uncharacterised protein [Tsukamurella tyrosinosolvens]